MTRVKAALEDASEERVTAATAEAAAALGAKQGELEKASAEVDGAKAEVAGIESGDGRDETNRSMPERLRDTEAEIVSTTTPPRTLRRPTCQACFRPLLWRCTVIRKHCFSYVHTLLLTKANFFWACWSEFWQHIMTEADRVQKQQDATVKKAKVAMAHLESEVTKADRDAQGKAAADAQLQNELTSKRTAATAAQAAFDAVQLDEPLIQQLEAMAAREKHEVQRLTARRGEVGSSVSHLLDFSFKSPRPNFDRSAVKGVLARLVRVKERKHALALEIAAGARMHNIVVTTNIVGARSLCTPSACSRPL